MKKEVLLSLLFLFLKEIDEVGTRSHASLFSRLRDCQQEYEREKLELNSSIRMSALCCLVFL